MPFKSAVVIRLLIILEFLLKRCFFTSDEQMQLLIFRIWTILGTAMEKLVKAALTKNESYVSRSSLLIA